MSTTRIYALLTVTKQPVKNCSALLGNRMQCWRAGDYNVTETTITPAVAATETTEAVAENVSRREYQLCRFHAIQESGKQYPEQPDEPVIAQPVEEAKVQEIKPPATSKTPNLPTPPTKPAA